MTTFDELEASIIAGALRARAPLPAAQARVRAKTMAAIATGAVVPGLAPSLLERLSSAAGDALESLGEAPTQARVLLGVAGLSAASAGGYALGFEAGRTEVNQATTERRFEPPVAGAASEAGSAPLPREPPSEAVTLPHDSTPRRAPSARRTPPLTSQPQHVDPEEEVRSLRRVERVLREHNPRFALALLSELDRTVPTGRLMEERDAARTVATCELEGSGLHASEQAAAFSARFPGSVYASRVHQACGVAVPSERIPTDAETDRNQ